MVSAMHFIMYTFADFLRAFGDGNHSLDQQYQKSITDSNAF
jgi:hypothetical protein